MNLGKVHKHNTFHVKARKDLGKLPQVYQPTDRLKVAPIISDRACVPCYISQLLKPEPSLICHHKALWSVSSYKNGDSRLGAGLMPATPAPGRLREEDWCEPEGHLEYTVSSRQKYKHKPLSATLNRWALSNSKKSTGTGYIFNSQFGMKMI